MSRFAPPQIRLPDDLAGPADEAFADWASRDGTRRIWDRDASLWTGRDEAKWLGWLDVVDRQLATAPHLVEAADAAKDFAHVVVLGMGGSSLCPDVMARTFGRVPGRPRLAVLDSTDPAQVKRVESSLDLDETLFIVASKSGSTLEPNLFLQYFLARVKAAVGPARTGSHFAAITDPGSKVEAAARAGGFLRVWTGEPEIGGRFSALSDFGMVPAAALGLDVVQFLGRARAMAAACREPDPRKNPGAALGVALAALAAAGRDKMTIVASPGLAALGAWLEQLVAESTGKEGRAILPVDGEPLGDPQVYGRDRAFVHVRLARGLDERQDEALRRLAEAGHPVVRIDVADPMDLGAEFFRWEFATAVAGARMGIHPFDQPDVEASKVETRKLTASFERDGALPAESPILAGGGLDFFADERNAARFARAATAEDLLRAHLARLEPGDYFGLLLYVDMNPEHEAIAQEIRLHVRDRARVATCVGFGPRFLHSTGQAYKGGPASGVFLQVTCDDALDLPVPGLRSTFGVVKAAQARGDLAVLASRGRRALRVHLGTHVGDGLRALRDLVARALA